MDFELVVFDCDGVLVDSEPLVNAIEAECFSRLGLALDPLQARALFKSKTTAEVAAMVEARLAAAPPRDWMYDWGMETALGIVRHLQAVPGVREVVAQLERRGTPTCVASQSPLPRVALSLAVTGLARFFGERVYTASMVARPKPAPDLFLHAAARMGFEPGRCAVVEDSASGIRAGRAAGMTVFGYAAAEDPAELRAAGAIVFDSMAQLPALLGSARA